LAAPEPGATASAAQPRHVAEPVRDEELDALFTPLAACKTLILAVSGGADSMALMLLAQRWAQRRTNAPELVVATVDHGLRAESSDEAGSVARQARGRGIEATVLVWEGDKPASGIQDAARAARYTLLAQLARTHEGPVAVVTAHTEDDQAETLLMRLARGSGLDGLAAMAPQRPIDDREPRVMLARPLLTVSGARLRATLQDAGVTWIEDPSNDAERFERVRIRKARALLAGVGLTNDKLALSARRLARVRGALDAALGELQVLARVDVHAGAFASLARAPWLAAPEELRLRLLGRLIAAFGGQAEPLRLTQLEALAERMQHADFEGATLAGAIISRHADTIRIEREAGRVPLPTLSLEPGAADIWDCRFRVAAAPASPGPVEVRALGAPAFARLRRAIDPAPQLPASAAATLPAFWRHGELVGVPHFAGMAGAPSIWEKGLYSAEFLGQGQSYVVE
jgi:tRNA(Ile)-lysidine synthase